MKLIIKWRDNRITNFDTVEVIVKQYPAVLHIMEVAGGNKIVYLFGKRIYFMRNHL